MNASSRYDEAENAILGAVVLHGRASLLEAAALVTEAEFRQPAAQSAFRAMRLLEQRGEPIDVITLEAQLRRTDELELVGGIEAIARLDRYATAHNIKAHAQLVREGAQARRLADFGRKLAADIEEGVDDVDVYLAQQGAALASISKSGRVGRQPWTSARVVQDMFAEKVNEAKGVSRGVSTGIHTLDSMLKGNGFRGGQLIVLGGRPKMGKTSLALSLTRAALLERRGGWPCSYRPKESPVPVLWACDEMRATELMERLVADVTGVPGHQLGSPSIQWLSRNFDRIKPAADLIGHAPLSFVPDADTHYLDRIFDYASHWRAGHPIVSRDTDGNPKRGPAIVVVDYLQRTADLPGLSRTASSSERAGAKAKYCKTKAQDLDVIVIALSQLSRALESRPNKRPMPSDFRDSGEIEQEADVLLAAYREIIYAEDSRTVYAQIDELTSRSGLQPDELDGVLAAHADPFLAGDRAIAENAQRCSLPGLMLDELAAAKRRVTETEILVLANRHGPAGVVTVDFFGEHYRFLARAEQ